MLYLGIILQEHTLRHKVYRKHCIHVKTKYGNSLTHNFSDFVLLIIMNKKKLHRFAEVVEEGGGVESVADDTGKVEICGGPFSV